MCFNRKKEEFFMKKQPNKDDGGIFMKKRIKKGMAIAMAVIMACSSSNMLFEQKDIAKAAENTLANESVQYVYVSDSDGLRTFIDNDGAYSSQDSIAKINEYSEVHKIVLDEPGTLYVCPLSDTDYLDIQLFYNFALTAKIGNKGYTRSSDREDFLSYKLKAGTYYYRLSRWNGHGSEVYTATTYLGFQPDSGKLKSNTSSISTTVSTATEVTVPDVDKSQGLLDYIRNDGEAASQESIAKIGEYSHANKITITEPGWLFVTPLSDTDYIEWRLYTNKDLTSKIFEMDTLEKMPDNPSAVYLEAGTYYYCGYRWNGHGSEVYTTTTYLGFMPTKNRISVNSVKLSADKTYATVTFDYDKEYLGSFNSGTIRVVKGKVSAGHITNGNVWAVQTKENALESNKAKITSNGTYTARIDGKSDEYYGMVSFKVTGIVKAPAAPKIKTAKKNTKVIKGTSKAKLKIYVKYNGKTYQTTANSKGNWTIKVSKKLTAKAKITAYAKNTNGAKSKITTYTVKK